MSTFVQKKKLYCKDENKKHVYFHKYHCPLGLLSHTPNVTVSTSTFSRAIFCVPLFWQISLEGKFFAPGGGIALSNWFSTLKHFQIPSFAGCPTC